MAPELKAGVARSDITPPVGIPHANWGAQTHTRAAGVDLDLWATALVLQNGDEKVAIVDADLGGFSTDLVTACRHAITELAGIPGPNVRLSAVHTHSGPSLDFNFYAEGGELLGPYVASLPGRIAGAVWEANNNLRSARLAAGRGHSDINVNRRLKQEGLYDGKVFLGRNWQGFADHEVVVARLDDEDEHPIATIVNFGCHPTIMGHLNKYITPDYPGVVKRVVEQMVGGKCLFLQGATGNVHAIRDYTGDLAVYRRLGTLLGLEAAKVALGLSPLPRQERFLYVLESGAELGIYADEPAGEPDGTLRVLSREIALPLLPVADAAQIEAELAERQRELEGLRASGAPDEDVRQAMMRAKRAMLRLRLAKPHQGQTETMVELHAIRVGGLGMVAIQGEPFAEIGAAVKQGSPFAHTMFSGYLGNWAGYIPNAADYPDGGYGVTTTPFAPEAAGRVIEESLASLRQLVE
ncbi:MAG: neutral/alkaline non-lysosomal ceramidase N-terminal domain-containing protein [Chloroflexi bacterium]|nr:neutral/alkaline non-lysosomal ceramidase N-terminal domain-containing protein [Chloroflexota bacterium]